MLDRKPPARSARAADTAPIDVDGGELPGVRYWKQLDRPRLRKFVSSFPELFANDIRAYEDRSAGPRTLKNETGSIALTVMVDLLDALNGGANADLSLLKDFLPAPAFRRLTLGLHLIDKGVFADLMLDLARDFVTVARRMIIAATHDEMLATWGLDVLLRAYADDRDEDPELDAVIEAYKRFYLAPIESITKVLGYLASSQPVRKRLANDVTFLDALAKLGVLASTFDDASARWTTFQVLEVLAKIPATDDRPYRIHVEVQRRKGISPIVEDLFWAGDAWVGDLEDFLYGSSDEDESDSGDALSDEEEGGSDVTGEGADSDDGSDQQSEESEARWSIYRSWLGRESTLEILQENLAMLSIVLGEEYVAIMAEREPTTGEWENYRANLSKCGPTPEGCDGLCSQEPKRVCTDLFGNPLLCDCCVSRLKGVAGEKWAKQFYQLKKKDKRSVIADPSKLISCPKCKFARYCSAECRMWAWENGHRELCVGYPIYRLPEGEFEDLLRKVEGMAMDN